MTNLELTYWAQKNSLIYISIPSCSHNLVGSSFWSWLTIRNSDKLLFSIQRKTNIWDWILEDRKCWLWHFMLLVWRLSCATLSCPWTKGQCQLFFSCWEMATECLAWNQQNMHHTRLWFEATNASPVAMWAKLMQGGHNDKPYWFNELQNTIMSLLVTFLEP